MRAYLAFACMAVGGWFLRRAVGFFGQHCGAQHFHHAAHCLAALMALDCHTDNWECPDFDMGNALHMAVTEATAAHATMERTI